MVNNNIRPYQPSPEQRDALTLIGLADNPLVAQQLLDCWTPGHLRKVALAIAQAVSLDMSAKKVLATRPPRNRSGETVLRRLHGTGAGPHRCDKHECRDLNRQWECDYRRARRAMLKSDF